MPYGETKLNSLFEMQRQDNIQIPLILAVIQRIFGKLFTK